MPDQIGCAKHGTEKETVFRHGAVPLKRIETYCSKGNVTDYSQEYNLQIARPAVDHRQLSVDKVMTNDTLLDE